MSIPSSLSYKEINKLELGTSVFQKLQSELQSPGEISSSLIGFTGNHSCLICNTRLNYWEHQDPAIMNRQKLRIAILAGILLTATALASGAMSYARGQTSTKSTTTVVRDSSAVLLDGKTIPAIDYIHLYDATPYKIMSGHVAAKLPCDTNSMTPLKMLVGQAPNLKSASLA